MSSDDILPIVVLLVLVVGALVLDNWVMKRRGK